MDEISPESVLEAAALEGLEHGNLGPMAKMLRAGYPPSMQLSKALANAIDPEGAPQPPLPQRRGPRRDPVRERARDCLIAIYVVEESKRAGEKSQRKAAVAAAAEKFGVSRASVYAALARVEDAWMG